MLCYAQKWVIHWYFKFWVFTFWTCRPNLSVEWHWLQIFLSQIFLHFGQFYLYSRQACSKWLASWTAIIDTLTLNGFAMNAMHGFDSWKWPNLTWNFSSSLKTAMSNPRAACGPVKGFVRPSWGFRCGESIPNIDNLSFLIILNLTFLTQVVLSTTVSRLHHCILDLNAFITLV